MLKYSFHKKRWSTFRAVQFCLLANSLPIILALIACFHQGERLDHRSCEALEVVLKSLHFDFINLQAAQLEENVSFMSKTYFPLFSSSSSNTVSYSGLSLYQIRSCYFFFLAQRNFITFLSNFRPCFLHFSPSLCFFFPVPGSIVLAGYDFVLWIHNVSWHFWQQQYGNIILEGPRSFDKAGWLTQWNSNLFM